LYLYSFVFIEYLLTSKVVSKSRVTWATCVPILVFLGLSVVDLGPMYAVDRRQTDRRQTASSLNASAYNNQHTRDTGTESAEEHDRSTLNCDDYNLLISGASTPQHLRCFSSEIQRQVRHD